MKRRMGTCICFALAMLICVACGAKEPPEGKAADYSGRYTDKQGTDSVYSELELHRNDDGAYAVAMSIYRTAALEGRAEDMGGTLHFVSDEAAGPLVEGDITVDGGGAEMVITESGFSDMAVGTVYRFPDGE